MPRHAGVPIWLSCFRPRLWQCHCHHLQRVLDEQWRRWCSKYCGWVQRHDNLGRIGPTCQQYLFHRLIGHELGESPKNEDFDVLTFSLGDQRISFGIKPIGSLGHLEARRSHISSASLENQLDLRRSFESSFPITIAKAKLLRPYKSQLPALYSPRPEPIVLCDKSSENHQFSHRTQIANSDVSTTSSTSSTTNSPPQQQARIPQPQAPNFSTNQKSLLSSSIASAQFSSHQTA